MRQLFASLALICALAFVPPTAWAHGSNSGHSHKPLSRSQAVDAAKRIVKKMTNDRAVDASWTGATVAGAEKKVRDERAEWVVTLTNSKIADAEKRTLYVFMTETGDYIAANHSGR
jgi:hypothetical protein